MRKFFFAGLIILGVLGACDQKQEQVFSVEQAKTALDVAVVQCDSMFTSLEDKAMYPTSIRPDGKTWIVNPRNWTSGFFPGSLWYVYEYTKNERHKEMAETSTIGLDTIKTYTGTHDLGFMINCSFGNGLRIAKVDGYQEIMLTGSKTLASRYDSLIKATLSWSWGERMGWQFPVIIDNMMNLELLFWASKVSGDPYYYNVAVNHATTTMEHHYRDDYSCYHVVDYDTITGKPRWKGTHQGANDSSAWSRGQSWGLYGYTLVYRETKDEKFLNQALKIADYILNHPNLPEDLVPYWDYNAPNIPNEERDASAATLMASAFLELSQYTEGAESEKFFTLGEKLLASLSSPEYLAEPGTNNYFVLKHSVGFKPKGLQIDVPINYTDYYYIEALLRYIELKSKA